ncbi:MAG TPA: hypothetical protein VHK88_10370, partial [Aquihabitans sp.]|nr:hypothetical protein [Aquihabitans sp.]
MHAIGPYRFTEQDVATTLLVGRPLFDLLEHDLPADALAASAPFRREAEDALDRLAPTDPEAALDV